MSVVKVIVKVSVIREDFRYKGSSKYFRCEVEVSWKRAIVTNFVIKAIVKISAIQAIGQISIIKAIVKP